jgi:ribosomal protein L29
MKRIEIEDKLHDLKEELVNVNIELSKNQFDKRSLKNNIRYYEDMLLNQIEMNFDDCE